MSSPRADRLRDAEKLLRQEKLEEAIVEYRALVQEQPSDWNTANLLGDLYLRTKAVDKAIEQFTRIADGYFDDGFLPKAAALYRKILKASPGHEYALLKTADIAIAQGLVGDARTALEAVRLKRRERGDAIGLAEVDRRQAALNPDDFAARYRGAVAQVTLGDAAAGVQEIKVLAAELMGRDRRSEAIDMMREALKFAPGDSDLRLAAVEGHIRDGRLDESLAEAGAILRQEPVRWRQLIRIAGASHPASKEAAQRLSQLVADDAVKRQDWDAAMLVTQDALSRTPRQLALLEPLALAARTTGATEALIEALDQIADIRLGTPEAEPPLAELVVLQPDEPRHEARLRQVRVMTGRAAVPAAPAATPAHAVPSPLVAVRSTPVETEVTLDLDLPDIETASADVDEEVDLSVALDEIPTPGAFAALPVPAAADAEEQAFARGSELLSAGRLDEAIAALEIAARAPRRRFETARLLGRLFRDRGDLPAALAWFERASEAPSADPQATNAALYDLAAALEDAGETTRALAIYLELQAELGVYRDVESRVERLMRVESGG